MNDGIMHTDETEIKSGIQEMYEDLLANEMNMKKKTKNIVVM